MKPQAAAILAVLRDGRAHSALAFKRGEYGFHVDAVSQRVGELRALGYVIDGGRGGHAPATYRLVSEPTRIPSCTDFDGALFPPEEVRSAVAARS